MSLCLCSRQATPSPPPPPHVDRRRQDTLRPSALRLPCPAPAPRRDDGAGGVCLAGGAGRHALGYGLSSRKALSWLSLVAVGLLCPMDGSVAVWLWSPHCFWVTVLMQSGLEAGPAPGPLRAGPHGAARLAAQPSASSSEGAAAALSLARPCEFRASVFSSARCECRGGLSLVLGGHSFRNHVAGAPHSVFVRVRCCDRPRRRGGSRQRGSVLPGPEARSYKSRRS